MKIHVIGIPSQFTGRRKFQVLRSLYKSLIKCKNDVSLPARHNSAFCGRIRHIGNGVTVTRRREHTGVA